MSYIDLTLGLGLGALITLIIRTVADARKEKELKENKRRDQITENFNDFYKRIIDSYCKLVALESRIKKQDQELETFVTRLERLEKRK